MNEPCTLDPDSVRDRLERALTGEPVEWPVYAVYDWFVKHRPIDWPSLFGQGLGQIKHADLVRVERPHLEIIETRQQVDGREHRTVRWITDRGELEESYVGEWQQEHLVKTADDYRVLCRAFENTRYAASAESFEQAEAELGDKGITLGVLGWAPLRRTPLLQVQIDFAGPERLALDLADEVPELMDLLELLTELTLRKLREAIKTPAHYIKLWENLAIEMIGPRHYRRQIAPMYRQILDILSPAGKRLIVHYDGKLRVIADDIAQLDLDIDSLTPAPEDRGFKMGQSSFRKGFFWPTLLLPFLLLGHGARGRETGPNLLRNGDFEDVAAAEPIGWTKSGSGTWSMEPGRFGERCLKIAVGTPNQERAEIWARSSDFAVTPGNLYLLVFWAKGEGLKCAEGVSSHVSWEFRKADGQDLPMLQEWRTDIWESCCAGRWNVGDMIVKAPAEATSARLVVWLGAYQPKKKGSVCLDRIRVAGYDPPAPTETTWFYRAATYGIGGDQVDDPQAKTGQAWKMTVKKHQPGGKISGPLIMDQEPGLYRAVFRMKAADRTSPRRLAFLRVTGDGLVSTGLTAGRTINGTDFAEPNQYQEFAVEFIRSPFGGLQYLVEWSGGTDLWLDGVTIHQERLLLDLDLVGLYGLDAGLAATPTIDQKAYVCQGLIAGLWRLEDALARSKTPIGTTAWLDTGSGDLLKMSPPFPQRPDELFGTKLLVLTDIHAQSLGFMGRKLVRDFVAAGGGLLVTGGFHSFGRGGLERSLLEEVLPVRVSRTFDLARCQPPAPLAPADASLFPAGIDWSRSPQCLWLHRVEVKPAAKVLVKAGEDPFLVVGSYGKGRAAVCLGTVLGKVPQDGHPFWQWQDWPRVMSEVIGYLKQQRRDW